MGIEAAILFDKWSFRVTGRTRAATSDGQRSRRRNRTEGLAGGRDKAEKEEMIEMHF